MDSTAHDLPPGTDVDRYRIEGPIGEGGFGSVYRATHTLLGHQVAIKILHPEHATNPEILERFFREARTAASVGSAHIVKVTDCGSSAQGQPFLVMELLEGEGLDSLLVCVRPVPAARALNIGVQILDGLEAAHAAGIVHRDLKPGNIFLAKDPDRGFDHVKLLDFGISKFRGGGPGPSLTQTGAVLGTPLYMAPEQFKGARDVDHRVDLYSAAAVLFEMLSGKVPHSADSYIELASQVMTEPAPRLASALPTIHPAVADTIDKGLSSQPETRWQTAGDFRAALERAILAAGVDLTRPVGAGTGADGSSPCDGVAWSETPSVAVAAIGPSGGDPGATAEATPVPIVDGVQAATSPAGALHLPSSAAPAPAPLPAAAPTPPAGALPSAPAAAPAGTPDPVAAGLSTTPSPIGTGGAPTGRRRSPLLWVGLGLAALLLCAGATVAVLLAVRATRAEPRHMVAPQPAPQPLQPQPQPLQPQPAVPVPDPSVQGLEPLGQLVQTLVDVAEEAAGMSGVQPPPTQPQSIQGQVRVAGDLDPTPIRQVLEASMPAMERCRLPGQAVQVRAQIRIVDPGRITMAAPAPGNPGPPAAAQCCADCFRQSVPAGFDPGSNGVVFLDVTLPGL